MSRHIAHAATGTSFLALWQFDLKVNYNSVVLLLLELKAARGGLRPDLSDALHNVFTCR